MSSTFLLLVTPQKIIARESRRRILLLFRSQHTHTHTVMAFNTADTRQRAYNRIDTCNPGGNWIDEKQFNKARPGAAQKILCGNWNEETSLEGDLMGQGLPVATLRENTATGRCTGGFESSPYLTMAVNPKDRRTQMVSTQQASYNKVNGDLQAQKQPSLGARSALRLNDVVQIAKDELRTTVSERLARSSGTLDLTGSRVELQSTYRAIYGKPEPPQVVHSVSDAYLSDRPITLYTGNPSSGKTMVVHGKTPDGSQVGLHHKHAHFSYDKYALGSLERKLQ